MFLLIDTRNIWAYGVGIGYALGSILGGAFAPLIAEALFKETGWSGSIGIYIMVLCVISFIGVNLVKETKDVPLGAGDPGNAPILR